VKTGFGAANDVDAHTKLSMAASGSPSLMRIAIRITPAPSVIGLYWPEIERPLDKEIDNPWMWPSDNAYIPPGEIAKRL
jgi:hypothetical protein